MGSVLLMSFLLPQIESGFPEELIMYKIKDINAFQAEWDFWQNPISTALSPIWVTIMSMFT